MALPPELIQHEVTVHPYAGTDGYGRDTFGTPFQVPCFLEDVRQTVLDKDGSEVVSESTFYADPGPVIPNKSKVILPSRETRVILVKDHDLGSIEGPSHLEVNCK
jgi:hypothetical protein